MPSATTTSAAADGAADAVALMEEAIDAVFALKKSVREADERARQHQEETKVRADGLCCDCRFSLDAFCAFCVGHIVIFAHRRCYLISICSLSSSLLRVAAAFSHPSPPKLIIIVDRCGNHDMSRRSAE